MTNFENLKRYDPANRVSRMYLPIRGADDGPGDGRAYLDLRYAGESNRGYVRELARRAARTARSRSAAAVGGDPGAALEQMAEQRADDRELYPTYVVTGWGGIPGSDGVAVPFSPENCADFVRALPDWLFDRVRQHASSPTNFLSIDDPTPEDLEVQAGN